MQSGARKLLAYALTFFGGGAGLVLVAEVAQAKGGYLPASSGYVVYTFLFHLGMAAVIASIVALVIERSLSEQNLARIGSLLGHHQELARAGFRSFYSNRQQFFDYLFADVFKRVEHELKIMGICVSLFKEADRPQRIGEWNRELAIKNITEIIERGCRVKILFLRRYPSAAELSQYGMSTNADFFFMRERDEDFDADFRDGNRLKIIANVSLGCWIQVLLQLATRTQDKPEDERREVLNRLQVREYIALPSLSLHIADDEIYVTPYLCKRHCSTVPAFQVVGKETDLFRAYNAHFESTWNDSDFTKSAFDRRFVELLTTKPKQTLEEYATRLHLIERIEKSMVDENSDRRKHPEHYRVQERAMFETLYEEDKQRALERLATNEDARRLKESGLLSRFVIERKGAWGHDEWTQLLRKIRSSGFYNLTDDEIGYLLEEEKVNHKIPVH